MAKSKTTAAKKGTAKSAPKPKKAVAKTVAKPQEAKAKSTKQQIIIDMLKRDEGTTLKQMMEATGWQRHSLHGAISGGLKKKLGLKVTSVKENDGETVYKIA